MLLQNDATVSDAEFAMISDLVHRHCGINLHDGKRELVQARIAKKLRTGGFRSAADYMDHVLKDPTGERFADLVDALSTNLTSFLRERNHFDYLAEHFVPTLVDSQHRRGERRLRAWSAGCSSGEEPYSLAMTLFEALPDPETWDIKILATDISRRVLSLAQRAVYDKARVESIPPAIRARHFTSGPERGTFQPSQRLRSAIRFNYLNLMEPWPFSGPFQFIFCRNVMIYFDKPTQERLVNRFWDVLDAGGLLFTGHSESLTGVRHRFRYVQPTIYAKA